MPAVLFVTHHPTIVPQHGRQEVLKAVQARAETPVSHSHLQMDPGALGMGNTQSPLPPV